MLEISVGPDLLRHLLLMIRIKEAPILFICFIFTHKTLYTIPRNFTTSSKPAPTGDTTLLTCNLITNKERQLNFLRRI